MKYRELGTTGEKISVFGLGTMTWGQQNSESDGHLQMSYALENGINFFDTAEMYAVPPTEHTYGKTEEIIGSWFLKTGNRSKVFLASKVVGANRGFPWIRNGETCLDKKNITAALEASLLRLKTDYIDLYQLHWPDRPQYHFGNHYLDVSSVNPKEEIERMHESLSVLSDLVKEGKIRYVGISNETAWGTMQYLELSKKHSLPRIQSIQNEYSLLCRSFDKDLQEVSLFEKVGLLAWSPLVCGAITGKYLGDVIPAGTRRSVFGNSTYRQTPNSDSAIREYLNLSKETGIDICHLAIAFTISRPFLTSTIVGATSLDQLEHNIKAVNVELSKDVLKKINEINFRYPRTY